LVEDIPKTLRKLFHTQWKTWSVIKQLFVLNQNIDRSKRSEGAPDFLLEVGLLHEKAFPQEGQFE